MYKNDAIYGMSSTQYIQSLELHIVQDVPSNISHRVKCSKNLYRNVFIQWLCMSCWYSQTQDFDLVFIHVCWVNVAEDGSLKTLVKNEINVLCLPQVNFSCGNYENTT